MCHKTHLVISQHWFRQWLGASSKNTVWSNVDLDLCRHVASRGHNELTLDILQFSSVILNSSIGSGKMYWENILAKGAIKEIWLAFLASNMPNGVLAPAGDMAFTDRGITQFKSFMYRTGSWWVAVSVSSPKVEHYACKMCACSCIMHVIYMHLMNAYVHICTHSHCVCLFALLKCGLHELMHARYCKSSLYN